jgi:hypothetical protein
MVRKSRLIGIGRGKEGEREGLFCAWGKGRGEELI